jgi:hypothetical protein
MRFGDTIMTPQSNQYIFIGVGFVLAIVVFYVFQVAKRMKALIAVKIKRTVLGFVILFIAANLLRDQGYSTNAATLLAMIPALLPLWLIPRPKRTRHVPAHVKRAVTARDGDGAYDGRRDHMDHIVPLAKGGDTSIENLRLLPKEANLKKGAKMPRLWDFL